MQRTFLVLGRKHQRLQGAACLPASWVGQGPPSLCWILLTDAPVRALGEWREGGQWNCALGWQLTKHVRARVCTALVTAVFCIQKTNTALRVGSCDPAKAHYSLADSAQLVLSVKSTRFQQSCCERRVASTASH